MASCHGGLVRRDVPQLPDQIPVQVIELAEGEDLNLPIALAVQQKKEILALEIAEPLSKEILAPQTVILKDLAEEKTPQIAENILKELKEDKKRNDGEVLLEVERKKDQQLVQQEIIEAVKEENQQVLAALEQAEEPKKELKVTVSENENENKKVIEIPVPIRFAEEKPQQVEEYAPVQQLKLVPLDAEEPAVIPVAVEENVQQPVAIEVLAENPDEVVPGLRQAVTQPTPTQTSTQQNFLQQLIQPVGQFISQFTGGQQQQQAAAAAAPAPAAPAAPLPTLPGFLNPSVAITSAQQAVQNAAQTVVNSTSQAFQGLQQFASNLGTSVQNTLSGLGGQQQQQLSTGDVTTTRPPGPFQAIISNFIGGGGQQQQAASETLPGTGGGPLQGIISFFQGGNRPAVVAAIVSTTAEPVKINLPTSAPGVDDKIDENAAQEEAVAQDENAAAAVASNEVRVSAEVVDDAAEDSFEESQPDELIVVNDDAGTESEPDSQSTN